MSTFDPLDGHLGNLTPSQAKTLQDFKVRLQAEGLLARGDTAHFWDSKDPVDWDDATLCRFLRARKFDMQHAYDMFRDYLSWYNPAIPEAYTSFPIDEFESSKRVYPQWTGRRDRDGRPVYVFKVADLDKQTISEYEKKADRLESRITVLYEHMMQWVIPFCDSLPRNNPEIPISAGTNIVDISNVSLQRFWALRGHMSRAGTLANSRYPETLNSIYLVGAPGFFSTVWPWICKLFDPATVAKITILPPTHSPADIMKHLSASIDPSSVPIEYGGTLDFEWNGSGPRLDEEGKKLLFGSNASPEIANEGVPKGSVRWIRPPGDRSIGSGHIRLAGKGRSPAEVSAWKNLQEGVDEKRVDTGSVDSDSSYSNRLVRVASVDKGLRTENKNVNGHVHELSAALNQVTV